MQCSGCHVILFPDDMGDDSDRPLCPECQEGFRRLDEYLANEDRFDFNNIKRFAGYPVQGG